MACVALAAVAVVVAHEHQLTAIFDHAIYVLLYRGTGGLDDEYIRVLVLLSSLCSGLQHVKFRLVEASVLVKFVES